MRSAAGGRFSPPPPLRPLFSGDPPQPQDEEEEADALSISDQRTLYLVNIFIGNTARFLNSFSVLCEDKLADVHRRILKLDATLNLLEAKLRNTCCGQEWEDNSSIGNTGSSSQPMLQKLLPHKRLPNQPCGSGESSRTAVSAQETCSVTLAQSETSHGQPST